MGGCVSERLCEDVGVLSCLCLSPLNGVLWLSGCAWASLSQSRLEGDILWVVVWNVFCEDCGRDFWESFLMNNFKLPVCNDCRAGDEEEGKYGLVTKTTAKMVCACGCVSVMSGL